MRTGENGPENRVHYRPRGARGSAGMLLLRPPGEPNTLFPGGRDDPARTGGTEDTKGSVHSFPVQGWAASGARLHFSCMVFRLTPSPLSRSQGPRTSKLSGLLGAGSEGPVPGWTSLMEEPPAGRGRPAEVSTDPAPASCFQTNTQPRFQLNHQRHLQFLRDPTTGPEKEVSWSVTMLARGVFLGSQVVNRVL